MEQNNKEKYHYLISVGVTWIDGRILFKDGRKWSNAYYGICHYSKGVFALTPSDYKKPLMIATILISTVEHFCERAWSCLNFSCPLNKFNKEAFKNEFKDSGLFSLGMPKKLGREPLWFNSSEYKEAWEHFIIDIDGGVLKFDENYEGSI